MNPISYNESDYINFLVATPKSYSCWEAGRVQPHKAGGRAAHDAINRMLHRKEPNSDELWQEAKALMEMEGGLLELDDSTLDKPYAKQIELVCRHWSGKHYKTVRGINLLTLMWSDGDRHLPVDYRIYDKVHDNLSKNDHARQRLEIASGRGLKPKYVCLDSWYSGLDNLKLIRRCGWKWFTRLWSNRLVNHDNCGNRPITSVEIGPQGQVVHLKGYGFIKVFRTVSTDGNVEHWATHNLEMRELERLGVAEKTWVIEHYHRGIKQFCGIERCQVRSARAQRNHIALAIRAFRRLECYSYATGHSGFEAKMRIIQEAVRAYLENPKYILDSTA